MSQPLLFCLAVPSKILRLNRPPQIPLPVFRSCLRRKRRRFSTRFVDQGFKQSCDRHNPCGFDRFAQETVSERVTWVRIVVHCGSDVLKRETELFLNAVSEAGLTVTVLKTTRRHLAKTSSTLQRTARERADNEARCVPWQRLLEA